MKNQLFSLIAIATIMGIAIFVAVSCSKTDNEPVKKEGVITHFSPQENMVEPTIVNFLNRYESYKTGYKSGGGINLGEAEWTIEAAVNYEFRGEKQNLDELTSDSLLLNASVYIGDNSEFYISESIAFALFENMLDFTNAKVSDESDLLVADVEIKEVVDGVVNIKLTTVVLGGYPNPCHLYSNDYWYAGAGAGKCNGYTGGVGKDAANKINTLLNCVKLYAWWSDIESKQIAIYWGPNYELCFWGMEYSGNWDDCLSPQDIDFWYDWACFVRDDAKPPNKSFIDCLFEDDVLVGNGTFFHYFNEIRYGIPHAIDPEE